MPSDGEQLFEYQSLLDGDVIRYLVTTERDAEPRFANVYCIKGPPHILIDAGLKLPQSDRRLLKTIEKSGCDPTKIESILITHGHTDHFGLARDLAEATGAKIFAHKKDRIKLIEGAGYVKNKYAYYRGYFRDYGVPESEVQKMEDWELFTCNFARTLAENSIEYLDDQTTIDTAAGKLTTLHLPGHSSGSLAFLLKEKNVLFSGDTVMFNIVPLPLIEQPQNGSDKPKSLIELLQSLERLKRETIDLILPGHGEPITSIDRTFLRIERYFGYGCRRLARKLAERPQDLFQLKIGTDLKGLQLELMFRYSEVVGMLEYMIARKDIALITKNESRLFTLID
jgi:glyoxylase-like metal-dependent hydrolase (beta-lactamase superfamily II)